MAKTCWAGPGRAPAAPAPVTATAATPRPMAALARKPNPVSVCAIANFLRRRFGGSAASLSGPATLRAAAHRARCSPPWSVDRPSAPPAVAHIRRRSSCRGPYVLEELDDHGQICLTGIAAGQKVFDGVVVERASGGTSHSRNRRDRSQGYALSLEFTAQCGQPPPLQSLRRARDLPTAAATWSMVSPPTSRSSNTSR